MESAKLKRKHQHPVRKEFVACNDNQFQCLHCSWTARLNATRMVKHIVDQCQKVPQEIREQLMAIQEATSEKLRTSSTLWEKKKDIHNLFTAVENKRICIFCNWCAVRNLTRMMNHIVTQCPKIPAKLRACFLKQDEEWSQTNCESYVVSMDEQWEEGDVEVINYDETTPSGEDPSSLEENHEMISDEKYFEIQELDERSCSWCGRTLTYDSCEVEIGNDVYCSTACWQKTTTPKRESKNASLKTAKKRLAESTESAQEQAEKKIKLVIVPKSVQKDNAARVKQNDIKIENVTNARALAIETEDEAEQSVVEPLPLRETVERLPAKMKTRQETPIKSPDKCSFSTVKKITPAKTTASIDEGSCHSFAGGHVYPQEDVRSADHKLQWTKAVISRPAPMFEATAVVEGAFKIIKLSDYRGKYLVFFFYPLDFTFVCPTEILAFSDRVKEFKKLNTEVIAASIDSHFTHLAWINTPRKEGGLGKINIPLLSDITHSISKDYGVYLDDLGHTLRGLFIIDDRGILRQITMNDLPVGRSVDETLRLVQAFQYTDKHGEVCPAGWKPGQDTIVPNPEEKIKYFEKNH